MPDRVKVPAPALVKVTSVPLIIPVTEATPLLVIDKALPVDKVIAAAVNVPVLIVKAVNGATPPTALANVVPAVVVVKVCAPSTVESNDILPAPAFKVVSAPNVTLPV